jgi:hypothetical protein
MHDVPEVQKGVPVDTQEIQVVSGQLCKAAKSGSSGREEGEKGRSKIDIGEQCRQPVEVWHLKVRAGYPQHPCSLHRHTPLWTYFGTGAETADSARRRQNGAVQARLQKGSVCAKLHMWLVRAI